MGFDDDGIRYGPTSMPKEVLVGLTKIRVSPSVLTIFQNGFFHAVCKHFLHISCAHKPYVVTRNFVVDCLEHENLKKNLGDVRFGVTLDMPNFLFKNLDGTMERGDKVLKNGIFAISTGQKLTEILQVNFFISPPFVPKMCGRDGVG